MTEAIETIGKVRLNKQWYNGSDLYSDGDDTENKLLDIVQRHAPDEYNGIIMREGSWPLLYHLSLMRENLVFWYPFRKGSRVLELGAGCGAVTGALLNRGLEVCAVDLSLRRCRINAYRHADCDELEIYVGAIEDVLKRLEGKFDYVLLIGALEYAAMFSDVPEPQKYMLECIKEVMNPDAQILVAIENQLGLKYLAGCREDHTGRFFEGVEGYPHHDGPRTFSRQGLVKLFTACGFESDFYYPYPDYKFPIKVFSDARLPVKGELNRNWHHFDATRMQLFDEERVADTLIEAGLGAECANSFLVRLTKRKVAQTERVVYVKSSVERKPEYQHHTLILNTPNGMIVRKKAASETAKAHLRHMEQCREALDQALRPGAMVEIAPCQVNDDGTVDFPFFSEETIRDVLSRFNADADGFCATILRFRDALTEAFGTGKFHETDGFRQLFGEVRLPEELEALTVSDLDMNFDNVFVRADQRYAIVDYEWVMPFDVPLSFILYRALLVNSGMAAFPKQTRDQIWDRLGIDEELREVFFQMELRFQSFVSGENNKLEQFKNKACPEQTEVVTTEIMLDAVQEIHRFSDDLQIYKEALNKQTEASAELTRQRDEYRKALDAQNEASAELTRQRDEYREALDAQSEASAELTRQRDEYREALDAQSEASAELTRQRDEYREALNAQSEASAELTRQRDEYRKALDAQNEASAELTRQRDEYHAANDELWKRISAAESALQTTRAELEELIRKHTPFWRRH